MKRPLEPLFAATMLQELPVFYRVMTKMETRSVGELKTEVNFSKSPLHQSTVYISYPLDKPVSTIDYQEYYEYES